MSDATTLRFKAVVPRQGVGTTVFSFPARVRDVARFARVERATRDGEGLLRGFQRPQIAAHVKEIREYLRKPAAILPNPIVVAFVAGATLDCDASEGSGQAWVEIDLSQGPPGWIVDGQQRFTALSEINGGDFEVLVSGFVCRDVHELHKQFILINNTRPLPKALVYELLPGVDDLPQRMSSRSQAAILVEALNYREGSALQGKIRQQTNPRGIIRDTVLQRVVMTSISDGALRVYADDDRVLLDRGYAVISEFFHAVRDVFTEDWEDQTPKTSRLVHGTGIGAMGYVMEYLHARSGAEDRATFSAGLGPLRGHTAWRAGEWAFANERRRWNGLQNVPSDVRQLADHLVGHLSVAPLGFPA